MEKKQVRLGQPVNISGLKIIPVTQTTVYAWQGRRQVSCVGLEKPLYILIQKPDQPLVSFTIEGQSISPQQIQTQYPELEKELENLLNSSH